MVFGSLFQGKIPVFGSLIQRIGSRFGDLLQKARAIPEVEAKYQEVQPLVEKGKEIFETGKQVAGGVKSLIDIAKQRDLSKAESAIQQGRDVYGGLQKLIGLGKETVGTGRKIFLR